MSIIDAIEKDCAYWIAPITISSSHFTKNNTKNGCPIIPNYTNISNVIDMLDMLRKEVSTNSVIKSFKKESYNYPSNAALELESFIGLKDQDKVINYIVTTSKDNGALLKYHLEKK